MSASNTVMVIVDFEEQCMTAQGLLLTVGWRHILWQVTPASFSRASLVVPSRWVLPAP